jgi:hypothetical protein
MVDESEHLFDKVVRIGYGIEICKYLWWHDLAALACVDRQCAEAVRWQREKGNTEAIWSQDINYHVIFRFKNINVTTNFPIKDIVIRIYKINNDHKTNTIKDKRYMRAIAQKKVIPDQYNRIIVIKLYGKLVDDSDSDELSHYYLDEEILVNYEDRDTIFISWKYFYSEQKIREKEEQLRREKIRQEKIRQEEIRQEEERKKQEEERKKRWHEKYDPILQKPNPWVKRH